jgi:tRNA (guanine-N7-)-methyltransferase
MAGVMVQREASMNAIDGPRPRRPHPYANAPRLPEGERVDVPGLVSGKSYELEIGPGRGGFLFERAAEAPDTALIGLEVRLKWAAVVDGRLAAHGLSARARVFAEDARDALVRLGPDGVFARVFVHFPDPWWKKRHAKRILLDARLLEQIVRLLSSSGELFVQTDVPERAAQYESVVSCEPTLVAFGDDASARLRDSPYEAKSPRERRALADGLPVHRMRWRRVPRG